MSGPRTRQQLQGAQRLLTDVIERLGATYAGMRAAEAELDGYGSGRALDGGGGGGSDVRTSTTERTALKALQHGRQSERLEELVGRVVGAANELVDIANRYSPPVTYSTLQCSAGVHETWWRVEEWGHRCDNVVPKERRAKGLCDRCRKRKERFEASQGVPG